MKLIKYLDSQLNKKYSWWEVHGRMAAFTFGLVIVTLLIGHYGPVIWAYGMSTIR